MVHLSSEEGCLVVSFIGLMGNHSIIGETAIHSTCRFPQYWRGRLQCLVYTLGKLGKRKERSWGKWSVHILRDFRSPVIKLELPSQGHPRSSLTLFLYLSVRDSSYWVIVTWMWALKKSLIRDLIEFYM